MRGAGTSGPALEAASLSSIHRELVATKAPALFVWSTLRAVLEGCSRVGSTKHPRRASQPRHQIVIVPANPAYDFFLPVSKHHLDYTAVFL